MKTNEELKALKEEVETLNKKLAELSEDELEQVSGGSKIPEISPIISENMADYYCGEKSTTTCGQCPVCGIDMICRYDTTLDMYIDIHCPECGRTAPNLCRLANG